MVICHSPVAPDALEAGDRVCLIGSNAGDHREGFTFHALQTHCRISVVALLPVLLPVLAPAPGA
jgi:hypothetical protein